MHRGAGAYICGVSETVLLDSLEGKRATPAWKPPFPAIQGFGDKELQTANETPTTRHDVTAAPRKVSIGTEQSTGTKVASVSGHVQRPGNYEIEAGISSREIICGLAGGPGEGREVKVWLGGSSALVLTGDDLDLPYTFEAMAEGGLMLGPRDHRRRRHRLGPRAGRCGQPASTTTNRAAACTAEGTNWTVKMLEWVVRGEATLMDLGHHLLGPGEHHRELPVRPRRRDSDAGRLDGQEVPRGVRGNIERARTQPSRWRHEPGPPRDHVIVVDGVEVKAREGEMLVDAAKGGDVEIPVFCYEPKLGALAGACRMPGGGRGSSCSRTACSTPVRDGMVAKTRPTASRIPRTRSSSLSSTIRSTARCATRGASARCRTSRWAGVPRSRVTDPKRHFQGRCRLHPWSD